MNCDQASLALDDFIDARLPPSRREEYVAHVGGCAACARGLDAAERLKRALAELPVAPPDEAFIERVLARAAATASRRAPRLVAAAFVAAFAASVATVIYTGLLVEAPRTRIAAGLPTVAMVVDQSRRVNLVFSSRAAVDDVALVVALPPGVGLLGREGEREVRWRTHLERGNNILPITLIASEPASGQLVARLRHGDREKVFRVHVSVTPG